jgi:two-component system nitrogen regulation response regulator GlnG
MRLGGMETIKVDVRIVAATNVDLKHEMEEGRFREDLYYRLHVISVQLPALRERRDDIPLLVQHFLEKYGEENSRKHIEVAPEALDLMMEYDWPGNVRELENVIYRSAVIAQGDAILVKDLPAEIRGGASEGSAAPFISVVAVEPVSVPAEPAAAATLTIDAAFDLIFARLSADGEPLLPQVEKALIARALAAEKSDETKAAKRLGLTKAALQKRRKAV